jgi:lipid-A-disaccharide synthase-like uncharacterized protein
MTYSTVWLGIGLVGQSLFFMRFFVQWIASERKGKSVIPAAFWYFSILGGLTLLVYAVHQRDIVFTIGQATGVFIYGRNIVLSKRSPAGPDEAAEC